MRFWGFGYPHLLPDDIAELAFPVPTTEIRLDLSVWRDMQGNALPLRDGIEDYAQEISGYAEERKIREGYYDYRGGQK